MLAEVSKLKDFSRSQAVTYAVKGVIRISKTAPHSHVLTANKEVIYTVGHKKEPT